MKIVAANGIRIACECFGERNGTVVLLISGLGAQMVRWAPRFCQALAGYGYRIIRFDNRDAGYSPHFDDIPPPDFGALISDLVAGRRPAVPYALTDMAADTIALGPVFLAAPEPIDGVFVGTEIPCDRLLL
jgi:pimeloyl-ACP methyl ester carboxylesterase